MEIAKLKIKADNPRVIKNNKFKKLVNSIREFPKMMELRPIVYDPESMEILGGNMRLNALKELGYKEIPDNWVKSAESLTDDEKKRFLIVDNVGYGEWDWDMLANEWDAIGLDDWGLTTPQLNDVDFDNINSTEDRKSVKESKEIICPGCGHNFLI